jgi:type II secretory pathway pseudopilin PulG
MVVVVLLAVIMALALPALFQARKSANEGAAIVALRVLANAQIRYRLRYGGYGTFAELEASGALDSSWSDGTRGGYDFTATLPGDRLFWSATADPSEEGATADRHFYTDESGAIHVRVGGPAAATDPALDT